MAWRKFSGEIIQSPILEEVEKAIERESLIGNKLKVCIGTDSQVKGTVTDFSTVIVFLREKRGGVLFINQARPGQKIRITERLCSDVLQSIQHDCNPCQQRHAYRVGMQGNADTQQNT